MPRNLRRLAFIFCLMPILSSVMLRFTAASSPMPTHHRHQPAASAVDLQKQLSLAALGLGLLGAVGLLVDAIRRPSDSAKAISVAVAGLGVITLGMASVVYYLVWGMRPTPAERGPVAETLCIACLAVTLDRSPPNTELHNLMGTSLIGSSDPCPRCGSIIRTGWIMCMVPLVPFGSYRTITQPDASITEATYVGRKLPGLFWPQVLAMYIMMAAMIAAGWWLLFGVHAGSR